MNYFILCGGSGSRLWPKSREKYPKQFLKLVNTYTMLQNTILRVNKLIDSLNDTENDAKNDAENNAKNNANNNNNNKNTVFIICNKEYYFIVEQQIKELNLNINVKIIVEPIGKDSAPAVCIASLIGDINNNSMIIPCDHIFDDNEFIKCFHISLQYIDNSIITFGIKPHSPEISYGYIKLNENNITEKFVEKPNYELALEYYNSNAYLWNAGIFIFKNKNMLSCYQKYCDDIFVSCKNTIAHSNFDDNNIMILSVQHFIQCRAISIDFAIMEYLTRDINKEIIPITIKYNSYWNDIGSYNSLYNQLDKDDNKNILKGDVFVLNSTNSYIDSENVFTATIGINNLIVVNTKDSLLICDNNETQNIKKVVEYLKKNKKEEGIQHINVDRPWGYFINIYGNNFSNYKVKKIVVYPNKRLSLQSHNKRSEHWVITRGKARVQVGVEILELEKDNYVYIPVNTLHRIENIGNELLEFTETQIGDYLGEDDIIRYDDDFGRN